jgi:hypothetical protein
MKVGDLIRPRNVRKDNPQLLGIVLQVHREKFKKTKITVVFPLGSGLRTRLASRYDVVSAAKDA